MLLLGSSYEALITEVELRSLQDVGLLVISLLSGTDFTKKGEETNISCVPGTFRKAFPCAILLMLCTTLSDRYSLLFTKEEEAPDFEGIK